jgi:predicted unusual protein kinase regulating ubiquinone biosynthesis (AarF/ABC1/UbiB family)
MNTSRKIPELLDALPADLGEEASPEGAMAELLRSLAHRPVPAGRLARLWTLGTLQAKIAAGYLAYWLKSGFAGEQDRERLKKEAHVDAAIKLLGGMGYLRGAIMKVGQALAQYPDIVPEQYVEVLGSLHFEAPPMHFSLLRELVRDELGADPEELFDDFETEAFAAASLGQVHRARLKSGEPVAVKVQYPNIARTIAADFKNMKTLLAPLRGTRDWQNLVEQIDDVRHTLEIEADYIRETEHTERARAALASEDDIVIPRSYPELSSRRVLTMQYLDGVHLAEFLEGNPSQQQRDLQAARISRLTFRLFYQANMSYADPSPGNFIFMEDGRLGLIDFGCCRIFTEDEQALMEIGLEALRHGGEAQIRTVRKASLLTDEDAGDEQRIAAFSAILDWFWEPLRYDGEFEFDDEYLRRGFELMSEAVGKRYTRSMPISIWNNRLFYGYRALMYRLRPRINVKRLHDEELQRAGLAGDPTG